MTDPVQKPKSVSQVVADNPKKAVVGGAVGIAMMIATPFIAQWEGKRNVAYKDVVGIPTICYGSTKGVKMGDKKTDAECTALLTEKIRSHMEPVLKCSPVLKDYPDQLAAATSLAFNIGGTNYCKSTVMRRFNARQWKAACDAFLMWNRAGGKVVQGLTNRREAERKRCLTNLPKA